MTTPAMHIGCLSSSSPLDQEHPLTQASRMGTEGEKPVARCRAGGDPASAQPPLAAGHVSRFDGARLVSHGPETASRTG